MYIKSTLIFLLLFTSACVCSPASVPLLLVGNEQLDACASQGVLKREEALREGPSLDHLETTRLAEGQIVFVCETAKKKHGWLAVVFSSEAMESCGVSSPIATKQRYKGPCMSGWLPVDSVAPLAG